MLDEDDGADEAGEKDLLQHMRLQIKTPRHDFLRT